VVEPWAAVLIGVVAGWIYIAVDSLLIRFKLDDAVAAIPVHLGSGFWGVIATGLLASPKNMLAAFGTDSHPGWFYAPSSANLLPAQLAGASFIILWTLATTVPFFALLDYLGLFRVNALEELIGLDMSYLEQGASPNELDKDEPTDNEVRLAAYRQRFSERKRLREQNKGVSVSNSASALDGDDDAAPKESYPINRLARPGNDEDFSRKGSVYSA
jgi:Ammonium Transporter Family